MGDGVEAGGMKHGDESVGLREAEDAGREVVIGALVTREKLAQQGKDAEGIDLVGPVEEFVVRIGELEDNESASVVQHTPHLAQSLVEIFEVADTKGYTDAVESAIVIRQRLSIGNLQLEGQALGLDTSDLKHTLGDVRANDVRTLGSLAGYGDGEVCGTCRDVENSKRIVFIDNLTDGLASPPSIDAQGGEVIEAVIA